MVSVASNDIPMDEEPSRDAKLLAAVGAEMLNGGSTCGQQQIRQRSIDVSTNEVGTGVRTAADTECSMCTNVSDLYEAEPLKEILDESRPIPVSTIVNLFPSPHTTPHPKDN